MILKCIKIVNFCLTSRQAQLLSHYFLLAQNHCRDLKSHVTLKYMFKGLDLLVGH